MGSGPTGSPLPSPSRAPAGRSASTKRKSRSAVEALETAQTTERHTLGTFVDVIACRHGLLPMSDRPPLSVVLATIEPWPDLANCLAVLEPQVAAVGGEIIVGDGHGAALDASQSRGQNRLRGSGYPERRCSSCAHAPPNKRAARLSRSPRTTASSAKLVPTDSRGIRAQSRRNGRDGTCAERFR